MEKTKVYWRSLRAAFLVAGTTIGAGMLGIPLVTAKAGFLPAVLISVCVWAFMLATGLLVLEVSLRLPRGANFFTISTHYLGKSGRRWTTASFLLLYFLLMVAYIAAGGQLFNTFFLLATGKEISSYIALPIFASCFGLIVAKSPSFIESVNFWLFVGLVISWIMLLGLGTPEVSFSRLGSISFRKMWICIPILFSSFGYHNVIPSLVTYLDKNVQILRIAIVGGTSIALVVYLLWQYLIIGILPVNEIEMAAKEGLSITSVFQGVVSNPFVTLFGQFFGFFALTSSLLGVSFSVVDFLADIFPKRARRKITLYTFALPLICTLLNPAIFEKALSIAGGMGESVINGLLPVLFAWSSRYFLFDRDAYDQLGGGKSALTVLILFSILAFAVEAVHLLS